MLLAQDGEREPPRRAPQREDSRRAPRVHDPSTIVKHNGVYWAFTTGRGVSSLRSTDLVDWERGPAALPEPPAWITDVVPSQRGHFWAPDVIEVDGRSRLAIRPLEWDEEGWPKVVGEPITPARG